MDSQKKTTIEKLLERGKDFNYNNFSIKSRGGYPQSLDPNWIAWCSRVQGAIKGLFGENSAPYELLRSAASIPLVGYGPDKFDNAKMHYVGALTAALEVLVEDTFGELAKREVAIAPQDLSNKVFIVHGHDEAAKNELEIMLREMGLDPIVLHRQADGGMTIIEKFEHYADVGFAFILLTPDEIAYLSVDDAKPDGDRIKEFRARPNVIWEFGYFVGRLGRERTCCLHRGKTTLPSDLNGLIYKAFSKSVEELGYSIQKELRALGYKLS